MTKRRDLTGQVFVKLTIIRFSHNDRHGKAMWLCKCECGKETTVLSNNIVRGIVTSCGCTRADILATSGITHGESGTIVYRSWKAMKNRVSCNDKYKKREIKVCERYANDFLAFKSDIGPYNKSKPTVDRTNTWGNYSCGKCDECLKNGWKFNIRWASIEEQGLNKINTIKIEYKGKSYFLPELARLHGISRKVLWDRINTCGWDIEKAVETPLLTIIGRSPKQRKMIPILN